MQYLNTVSFCLVSVLLCSCNPLELSNESNTGGSFESEASASNEKIIQVNSRYVFVGSTSQNTSKEKNIILDLSTGKKVKLSYWPSNSKRVYANTTHAYYVSDGKIWDVTLSSGESTLVSTGAPLWSYSLSGYNKSALQAWNPNTWIYVDPDFNLYAINYINQNNGYNTGMGAKLSLTPDGWIENVSFNETFFPNMPYGISNAIPGAAISGTSWLITDQNTSLLYNLQISGTFLNIYYYDLDTWSNGSLITSVTLDQPLVTTYLGYYNTVQSSIITDGQTIIKLNSNGTNLSTTVIQVPESIPAENTITTSGGYVSAYIKGTVTNWSYLQDTLFFLNMSDNKVYQWDLNPAHAPSPISNEQGNSISFPIRR